MTLSRKEFFRHSLLSLGETLLTVGETLRDVQGSLYCAPLETETGSEPQGEPAPGTALVARVDNRHCLAKHCGCFACIEQCEAQAIFLVMGEGIRINAALCTGCGACHSICPLAPQALALVPVA